MAGIIAGAVKPLTNDELNAKRASLGNAANTAYDTYEKSAGYGNNQSAEYKAYQQARDAFTQNESGVGTEILKNNVTATGVDPYADWDKTWGKQPGSTLAVATGDNSYLTPTAAPVANPNDRTVIGGTPVQANQPGIVASAATPATASTSPGTTVAGNLQSLMDPNSALGQQATTQGLQFANERGLLNSSIAQSAAQDSLLRAATPIATADAGNATQLAAARLNADTSLANAKLSADTSKYNTDASTNTQLSVADKNITATKALNLDNQTFQRITNGSASATNLMTNLGSTLTNIDKDPNFTDPVAKQAMKANAINTAKAGLRLIGAAAGDVDFGKFLNELFPD